MEKYPKNQKTKKNITGSCGEKNHRYKGWIILGTILLIIGVIFIVISLFNDWSGFLFIIPMICFGIGYLIISIVGAILKNRCPRYLIIIVNFPTFHTTKNPKILGLGLIKMNKLLCQPI